MLHLPDKEIKNAVKNAHCKYSFRYFLSYLPYSSFRQKITRFFLYKDNQKALVEWSKKLNTDLTIVYSSPFIFIDELVHSSPLGTINIHPSLLPKYRGPQPLLWQYLDFDLNAGVTIHYIAKKEDTGDIIMQREFKIAIGTPYIQTVHNSENIGYQMIIDVMESIEKGQYTRIKQPEHSSTERAYRIDKKLFLSAFNGKNGLLNASTIY